MTTALLIIDVQQAMCTGDYAAFDIDRVIDRINVIAAGARSAGLPVVLVQHQEDEGPLQSGTEGWQLAARLHTQPDDLRVHKATPDSFHRTELHPLLQSQDVQRLVVCGLQTEYCVDTTVRRALALGYEVLLVADAHSTRAVGRADRRAHQHDPGRHEQLRSAGDGEAGPRDRDRGLIRPACGSRRRSRPRHWRRSA
jgi:nicotinamidase-related amidase